MTTQYRITNQKQLRDEFWSTFEGEVERRRGGHNQQPTDTRVTFVDWVDSLERNGDISPELAQRATLG